MTDKHSSTRLAFIAVVGVHAALLLTGYFGLVSVFEFPDILRQPPAQILEKFRSQQSLVQAFYAAFMWSQIAFVGVVLAIRERFGPESPLLRVATHFGVIAGFAQAIGFSRWPFVIGSLADKYQDAPETTLTVLDTVHRLAGVAIGEHLFFCFETLWAVAVGIHFLRNPIPAVSKKSAAVLLFIGGAIGVYSLEQFGGWFAVLGPVNVLAHGALLFWLIGVALSEAVKRPLKRWETAALMIAWAVAVSG